MFRKAASFQEVDYGDIGQVDNFLFINSGDPSNVIVFFNGAISPLKVGLSPLFQRWTWQEYFRHPAVVIHDPLIRRDDDLRIAWYIGTASGWCLADLFADLERMVRAVHPDARFVCLGSSAGGFAALMAAVLGLCDLAIVNNPQTNLVGHHADLRDRFLTAYGKPLEGLTKEDVLRLSASDAIFQSNTEAEILYLQNLADTFHTNEHFLPFMEAVYRSERLRPSQLIARAYFDSFRGHSPLEAAPFLSMIDTHYPALLSPKGKALAKEAVMAFRERERG